MFKKRIMAIMLMAAMLVAGLGACQPIREFAEVAERITQDLPTAADTLTSLFEINAAMTEAMSRGESELTFNATGISEDELRNISSNFSTFWGVPVRYSINSEFKDIEGIVPGQAVNVRNITNYFELSSNFYVHDFLVKGTPIPEDQWHAQQVADTLPAIAAEIFPDPGATDYEKTLAAHDWLVANVDYDDTTPERGEENGSYGAIVLRRTMCLGYSEALELLLKCYTDIEVVQIVGEALNYRNEFIGETGSDNPGEDGADGLDADGGEGAASGGGESAEGDVGEGGGEEGAPGNMVVVNEANEPGPVGSWGGHAWNIAKLDGAWYQIDPTFDDPRGNPSHQISHFYFGQTDAVMTRNHRWTPGYFPVADTENFLYFRNNGLFAEDWEGFQAIMTERLLAEPMSDIEIAVKGVGISEDNIQFLYQVRYDLEEIWWNEQAWEDIHVNSIELIYSDS